MESRHCTDEELIARLYGVGSGHEHLQTCAQCRQRSASMGLRQEAARLPEPQDSPEFFAAQRRAILQRTSQPQHRRAIQLVPLLASALVLLLAVILSQAPSQPQPRPKTEITDAQLFEEVFAMVSREEPRAVGPVHSLFEVTQR